MKWFIGFLASLSALLNVNQQPIQQPAPLNAEIIAYHSTYYLPAVSNPNNFPRAKTTSAAEKPAPAVKKTVIAPPSSPPPPPPPPPPAPPKDSYLPDREPIIQWLRMDVVLGGDGFEGERIFPAINFDREYWRADWRTWWISLNPTIKTPVEADYFKLEIYEEGTDKLIFRASSKNEESFFGHQVFQKPGKYYFKTYTKPVSKYEIELFVSPKLAQ